MSEQIQLVRKERPTSTTRSTSGTLNAPSPQPGLCSRRGRRCAVKIALVGRLGPCPIIMEDEPTAAQLPAGNGAETARTTHGSGSAAVRAGPAPQGAAPPLLPVPGPPGAAASGGGGRSSKDQLPGCTGDAGPGR